MTHDMNFVISVISFVLFSDKAPAMSYKGKKSQCCFLYDCRRQSTKVFRSTFFNQTLIESKKSFQCDVSGSDFFCQLIERGYVVV